MKLNARTVQEHINTRNVTINRTKNVQTAMGVKVLHIRAAQSIISTPTKSTTLSIRENKPTKLKRQLLN